MARKRQKITDKFTPRPIELRSDEVISGVTGLIGASRCLLEMLTLAQCLTQGNTPLVRINSLSDALGVEILGKAEFLNPGGSVKDRVALCMINDAERLGLLRPHTGSRIFEGTVGSTGISIATIARAKGYDATIILPDDVAKEKVSALQALGATVEQVRPASIVDKKQNLARQRAAKFGRSDSLTESEILQRPYLIPSPSSSVVVSTKSLHVNFATNNLDDEEDYLMKPRGFFADQFEASTGGTIAGVGQYIKSLNKNVVVALADPEGSGLYNKVNTLRATLSFLNAMQVKYGVMFDRKESEGTKRRHQVDTVVEGIGINRLTNNIDLALPIIDDAFRISDAEAVSMSRYLVQHDGLFLGSSSACNLVACVKLVRRMGWAEGQTLVTILCDSGSRHYSKFW
ncbi:hypothetical protein C0995_003175 [Termitomyces sp. Mi166|nr:hypothetical protein C0995_003175 [Termitomyces sp. Mi166\